MSFYGLEIFGEDGYATMSSRGVNLVYDTDYTSQSSNGGVSYIEVNPGYTNSNPPMVAINGGASKLNWFYRYTSGVNAGKSYVGVYSPIRSNVVIMGSANLAPAPLGQYGLTSYNAVGDRIWDSRCKQFIIRDIIDYNLSYPDHPSYSEVVSVMLYHKYVENPWYIINGVHGNWIAGQIDGSYGADPVYWDLCVKPYSNISCQLYWTGGGVPPPSQCYPVGYYDNKMYAGQQTIIVGEFSS